MAAVLRLNEARSRLLVLCPVGHVIDSYPLNKSFGGSWLEAEIGYHANGVTTLWDRLASLCTGFGHQEAEAARTWRSEWRDE